MQLQLMTLNNKSILPGSDRDRDKLYQGLQTEPSPVSPTSYVRQLPYPSSRRDSEVLPPLDPNVYYHLDLQPGLPKPVIQSQHHIRRSTEPNTSEFSWSKSPKYHYLPAPALVPAGNAPQSAPASATTAAAAPGKITLPPLSSIAPATGTSPGSEPRSRDDSFTATVLPGINAASTGAVPPSAAVMAEQRSPLPSQAMTVKLPQRAAVAPQAPPQYIQPHQPQPQPQHQPQPQPHHPQHQPQSHPQHQPQPQPQPQHSPTYQFYPLPQEYQYPAYIYPSQHAPHQQQYPVHMVHQPYRPPQFAQPMYQQIPAPPQVPNGQQQMRLLIAQPGMAQGASMAPVFYHQHPISFAHIDNTKKVPRRRTRTGCLTCRKRRIKCDERKPHCLNCEKSRKVCLGYEQPPFQNKNRKYKDELSLDEQEGVREGGAGSSYSHGGASKADSASLNEGESGIQA